MKQTVDVIAMHSKEGTITPLRIRLVDEEGERREFTIKSYRDVSGQGARTMPDGMSISNTTLCYECYIEVGGTRRLIRLYYSPSIGGTWTMTDMGK